MKGNVCVVASFHSTTTALNTDCINLEHTDSFNLVFQVVLLQE